MATVTVLAAVHINRRKVARRLARIGYSTVTDPLGERVSRHGRWDAVYTATCDVADLPQATIDAARKVIGPRPKDGIICSFDGGPGEADAWPTVVEIARAVATDVPLAVLHDHAGTTYLIHPQRGLLAPQDYEADSRTTSTGELLRRFMGGD